MAQALQVLLLLNCFFITEWRISFFVTQKAQFIKEGNKEWMKKSIKLHKLLIYKDWKEHFPKWLQAQIFLSAFPKKKL